MEPLAARESRIMIEEDQVDPGMLPAPVNGRAADLLGELIARICAARQSGHPVIMAFGAHTIKNGLGPVLIRLMEEGWVTHLATNGAVCPLPGMS